MSVKPRNPGKAPPAGASEPIDLVAEIKRRKRTTRSGGPGARSTAPASRERSAARGRESEFALGRSSQYSLTGALGLDEPGSPDDVLDALDERTTESGARVGEDSSPSGIDPAGMSGDQLGEDAIGERLHRHHELAHPRPAVSEALRGSAQLAPAHLRRPGRPRRASATEPLRAHLTGTRARRRRLFGVLAVAGVAAALAGTIVLIVGGSSAPRQARQTAAARPGTATAPLGQPLSSLMARVHGEVADEAQAAARLARERAQRHQARRRRERAQRRKRALARERAAARSHANRGVSTSAPTSQSDGATTSSLTAPPTVTVTTPAVVSSSASSSSESDSGSAGPTGVGSSSGGCDPKCR